MRKQDGGFLFICYHLLDNILFQFFYLFLGKTGILHDQIDVNAISKHVPGNIQGFLVHTLSYTFTLGSVYGILDVAICHLAGLVLPHFLRSKLGYLSFLEEAVENLVAQLLRTLGKLIEVLQCIEPLLVERIQFFQGFVELGEIST